MRNFEKRVTFLISSLRGGGTETVCVRIANGLVARGWQVELLVINLVSAVHHVNLDKRVRLINLDRRRAAFCVPGLFCYLRNSVPRNVLVFNPQLAVLLFILRPFVSYFRIIARAQNLMSVKRVFEVSFWHRHFVHLFIFKAYSRVDALVAQSHAMRDDLLKNYNVSHKLVKVINNPLSAVFERFMDAPIYAQRGDYVLCVGRLVKQKGFDQAIHVFSRISKQYPHLRLVFVGEGEGRSCLVDLADSLGVGDRVDFYGYCADILPIMREARSVWMTSLYEGFPNVLIESISVGTPVVAFDCLSGPAEIIKNGINGFLVEPGDISDFVGKAKEALSMEWVRSDIVTSAARFRAEEILNEYESVILG